MFMLYPAYLQDRLREPQESWEPWDLSLKVLDAAYLILAALLKFKVLPETN